MYILQLAVNFLILFVFHDTEETYYATIIKSDLRGSEEMNKPQLALVNKPITLL